MNETIFKAQLKARSMLAGYSRAMCSVSGGADSDVVIDIVEKCKGDCKIRYVFFDTGLELKATKEHLEFLEQRYGITIERYKAREPVAMVCKKHGQPFVSKLVSEMLETSQKHNVNFSKARWDEDDPSLTRDIVKWWNTDERNPNGTVGMFSIARNKWLKEYLMNFPLQFKVSAKCCDKAKKKTAIDVWQGEPLTILGLRRSEGGLRAQKGKTCFQPKGSKPYDMYSPIYWFTNSDREEYVREYNIIHSDAYAVYGLVRTGCMGCPFNRKLEEEISLVAPHEPQITGVVNNIFGDSYKATQEYRLFAKVARRLELNNKKLSENDRLSHDDIVAEAVTAVIEMRNAVKGGESND